MTQISWECIQCVGRYFNGWGCQSNRQTHNKHKNSFPFNFIFYFTIVHSQHAHNLRTCSQMTDQHSIPRANSMDEILLWEPFFFFRAVLICQVLPLRKKHMWSENCLIACSKHKVFRTTCTIYLYHFCPIQNSTVLNFTFCYIIGHDIKRSIPQNLRHLLLALPALLSLCVSLTKCLCFLI